jgi:putative glycosyltransferase (TIGR04348 family)
VKITLVTPAPAQIHTGNRTTADRWARLLRELGNEVNVQRDWNGEQRDLLIALHARRSFPAMQRFREKHPRAPLILVLTGTDIYSDLGKGAEAMRSLDLATRIVVLQELAVGAVPESSRGKVNVIYQSAEPPAISPPREKGCFQVCVLAHMRRVKDPLRAAYAARELPASSRIQIKHAGAVLDPEFEGQVEGEQRTNLRYRWLGPLTHEKAVDLLARSHLLALTSHLEGGANVVSEAIAVCTPVISSLIPGSIGILGKEYPGYFPVGDTVALRKQLQKAESNDAFYGDLQDRVARLRPLVSTDREREAWSDLLTELR